MPAVRRYSIVMGAPANDHGLNSQDPSSSPADTADETVALYRAMNYEEFLRTDYWANVRAQVLAERGRCQLCSAHSSLVVHHNSYENHGSEPRFHTGGA